jgi:hypothetical protein
MQNLIHQDIAVGHGVAVIDPHGSIGLVNDILKKSIPESRINDVVLLECGQVDYPVPLNPFRVPAGVEPDSVFTTVLWLLKSIYKKSWSESRMEYVARNVLHALLADPEATPLDIRRLVEKPKFRNRILSYLENSLDVPFTTVDFWREFGAKSPGEQRNMTNSLLYRTNAFLGSTAVELMTCHPHTLNFSRLIADKKIVLIDLSGSRVQTEVDSLGAIFLANFYLACMGLGEMASKEPRFYLYVDETQRFITSALQDMFSEARKFGLSLTLANQYIGQLDNDTVKGIQGNVGTKFSFECSPEEARATAKLYEPEVTAEELSRLGAYQVAVRTRKGGKTLDGFVMKTLPPPEPLGEVSAEEIRKQSRENLALIPAEEVDRFLDQRYTEDTLEDETEEYKDFD